jgi:DNA-binding MarR family transcriptional regulator
VQRRSRPRLPATLGCVTRAGYPAVAVHYHPPMAELTNAAVQRLLLLMADYGRLVATAMREVSPDPELVSTGSLLVLCALDLDGPQRPGVLQDVTGLSSGGVSKLLDRMEQAGVIKRTYGGVAGDNRGVLVSITRRGRALTSRVCGAVASQLPEPRSLVKAIAAVVEE